ncbi:serine protease inhibitor Kazal-type family protein [Euphorbia peplus]|nr:serine protease inhibitor Kazal-type family protein [Euphorbia peplus]
MTPPSLKLPLYIFIAVFLLSFPQAQSNTQDGIIIQQIINKDGDLCAGVSAPASCPFNCFRADPVCGVNGVTYWCGCPDAVCQNASVAKFGHCEVFNGGSGSLPHQALLLVHILWLILLGFSLLFGLF